MTAKTLTNVLDFTGPEFLWFYAISFAFALVWSLVRRSGAQKKFSLAEAAEVQLSDPYELAFLAGGAPRCTQVVVVRLIKAGAVEWKKARGFSESKLIAKSAASPDFNDIERTVYSSILSYGKKGIPLSGLSLLVGTRISGIEAKLAKLGLRPTQSEEGGRGCFIALPLAILAVIGVVKVAVGISRDKPVGFLVVFLIVTFFAMALIAAARKKLTPAGEALLEKMRREPRTTFPDATLCGVALLGISGIGYDESLAGMDVAFRKEISQLGNASSSSGGGSGCSSGCGSGCGGCGGD